MESADTSAVRDTRQPVENEDVARTNGEDDASERANARPVDPDERANGRTHETGERSHDLTEQIPRAPKERKPGRNSFQFWDDQIVRLKRIRQIKNLLRDPYERKEITMSDMVRQAIDEYLDKQTKRIKRSERPVV